MMEEFDAPCTHCGAPSNLVCCRCMDNYCSIQCQVEDWQEHRMICIPMPKLVERPFKITRQSLLKEASIGSESGKVVERRVNLHNVKAPRALNVEHSHEKAPAAKELGLITSMTALGINKFKGHFSVLMNEHFLSIIVDLPEKLVKQYDELLKDLNKFAPEFENGIASVGNMIAVKGPASKVKRAVVIAVDLQASAAVVYYCDFGDFDVLTPLPAVIKVCPEKYSQVPGKAILVELISHVDPDRNTFLQGFFHMSNTLIFDIKHKQNTVHDAEVSLSDGKHKARVLLYETTPNLKICPQWSVQIPSDTLVKILRVKFYSGIRVWILPTDHVATYDALLCKIAEKLDSCKTIPILKSMVVHVQGTRGTRLIVTNHLAEDLVEVNSIDKGSKYTCNWNQLKIANDFVKNLPAYGMEVEMADLTDARRLDQKEIMEYLQSIDYLQKEYVLQYSGYYGFGVKLISKNESLGQMIVKHFDEKQEMLEEMARKQKENESNKQRKLQEEMELKKAAEEEERHKKMLQAQIQRQLAAEQDERNKKAEQQRQRAVEEEQRRTKVLQAEMDRQKAAAEEERRKLQEAELRRQKAAAEAEERQKKLKEAEVQQQKAAAEKEMLAKAPEQPKSKNKLLERLQKAQAVEEPTKYFINDLNLIPLEVGRTTKFVITDPGLDGFVGVCEESATNNAFLQEILAKCEQYIAKVNVKDLIGYRPETAEICLTCYEDGLWYRAQCLSSAGSRLVLLLIDFGTIYNIGVSKIIPFPEELKEPPPRTHLVNIQDSDKHKTSELQTFGKYRFKVESFQDDMYHLAFA